MTGVGKDTFACIILYNPDIDRLRDNISSIKGQVNSVILVDNNSSNIDVIDKEFGSENSIQLIKNKKNVGIANALNIAFEKAKESGVEWVLTLDQDSIADVDMLSKYDLCIDESVGIVCPQIIDINVNKEIKRRNIKEPIYQADDVITSGSLVRVSSWEQAGKYDDRLFIDYVDTEFQERILRLPKTIIRTHETYLLHEIGMMKVYRLGPIQVYCSNHSAFRRYYMVRNRLYYRRKYFGYFAYIKEKIRLHLGDVKILIFEDDKRNKMIASQKGYKDYKLLMK